MCVLRKCRECGIEAKTEEALGLFKYRKYSKHNRDKICKSCANKNQRSTWRDPNASRKKHQVSKRYGITLEEYNRCMATSDCCEVCGTTEDLCYDHCHDSMEFRGVLCRGCNRSIGQLGDSLDSVRQACLYLERAEKKREKNSKD